MPTPFSFLLAFPSKTNPTLYKILNGSRLNDRLTIGADLGALCQCLSPLLHTIHAVKKNEVEIHLAVEIAAGFGASFPGFFTSQAFIACHSNAQLKNLSTQQRNNVNKFCLVSLSLRYTSAALSPLRASLLALNWEDEQFIHYFLQLLFLVLWFGLVCFDGFVAEWEKRRDQVTYRQWHEWGFWSVFDLCHYSLSIMAPDILRSR